MPPFVPPAHASAQPARTKTRSFLLPLLFFAATLFLAAITGFVVGGGLFFEDGFRGTLQRYFLFSPWAGLVAVFIAGVLTTARPVSRAASICTAILGAVVVVLGLSTFWAQALRDPFERLDSVFWTLFNGPAIAMLLGIVTIVASLGASKPGRTVPTVAIWGLLAAALVNGLRGVVFVALDIFPPPDGAAVRATILSASFDFRSALMVLAAAGLLVLAATKSNLGWVVAGAATLVALLALSSVLAGTSGDRDIRLDLFVFVDSYVSAPATVACCAVAGFLALMAAWSGARSPGQQTAPMPQ